ncbi:MAG: PAS domain S-box protein [Ramlibacter sp.]|nr:PAS domain S-box protein [Ramlibacter sp.]
MRDADDRTAQLLSDFFDKAAIGLHWVGPDGIVLRVNRTELDLLGYAEHEYVGHHISEFHADEGAIQDVLARLTSGETLHNYEARLRCKDGSIKHVLISSNVLRENGKFVHTRCFTRDVSALKETQRALAESERRKSAILAASLDAIITMDHQGRLQDFNPAAERIFGYTRDAALGKPLADVMIPPRLREQHRNGLRRYLATGEGPVLDRRIEVQAMHAHGHEFPAELSISRVNGIEPPLFTATVRNISERKKSEEELHRSSQLLRGTFEQAAVGIAICALDGHLVQTNLKFREIMGYSAEELALRTFLDVTHHDDQELTAANVRQLLAGEIPHYAMEKRYIRKDGVPIWSLTTVTLMRADSGQSVRFIGVIEEITERKKTQQALQRSEQMLRDALEDRRILLESERAARSAAERLSEMKDEFLATLSHELRTPLSAILGWAHILRRGPGRPEDLAKGLDVIERNSRIQTQLIDELLDTSRITSGKVRLDIQPLDPTSFVLSAIETVRPAADAKRIRIDPVLDAETGAIPGDAGRLQQVVWNLLSNAIKFTPPGGTVQVRLQRLPGGIEVTVHDNGAGISPDFLPHVFERFRQADASTTRRHGGLGLGLAIVRSLVEQHGGSVQAASAGEGQGATFTVRLPSSLPARPMESRVEHVSGAPREADVVARDFRTADLAGLVVLVVDDEADARNLLERVLTECDAAVLPAASAAVALRYLDTRRADILVSDIGMPDVDGYALIRRIRALAPERGGAIPAIALTAFARPEDRERALQAGFQEHMAKPVEPSELVSRIAELARGRALDALPGRQS